MNDKDFEERALIELHRKYGKDELVSVLNKKISEKDIEIGKLKSYVEELEYTLLKVQNKTKIDIGNFLANPKNLVDEHGYTYISFKKYNQIQNENKKLKGDVKRLQRDNRELIAKNISKNI